MDNIVGSRIGTSKFETKSWRLKKANLQLTSIQSSLIVGSLLGDGTMRIGDGAVNANFKVEHGLEQKELVFWKYEILKPWVFTEPKISYRYDQNGKKYKKSWWFRTIRHPILTNIQKAFYPKGKKIIPNDLPRFFNEFALACWIMDDGSYSNSKVDISTYSFTLSEVERLLNMLANKFSLEGSYYRDRDKGYRMYFRKSETIKMVELIEPHVIPSMRYKIGFQS
ncbi:MAG: LAGLIDADG endonuclease [Patescibacteria group bacterium]